MSPHVSDLIQLVRVLAPILIAVTPWITACCIAFILAFLVICLEVLRRAGPSGLRDFGIMVAMIIIVVIVAIMTILRRPN
jgi:hypothetical protein